MSLYILRDAHETLLFYFLCRGRISLRLARKRSRSAGLALRIGIQQSAELISALRNVDERSQ